MLLGGTHLGGPGPGEATKYLPVAKQWPNSGQTVRLHGRAGSPGPAEAEAAITAAWSNRGQNRGQTVVKQRSNRGQTVVKRWSNSGLAGAGRGGGSDDGGGQLAVAVVGEGQEELGLQPVVGGDILQ